MKYNIHRPLFFVLVVLFMANLNAVVDEFMHHNIPYFDHEHIIVGITTAVSTAVLLILVWRYTSRLKNIIGEREQAEKEIRKVKEEWERTFNATSDLVSIQDKEMRIIRVNRAVYESLNTRPEEVIGKYCYEVFRGVSEPCAGCPEVTTILDLGKHFAEIEHSNLGKTFLVSAAPIFDESNDFTGIIHIAKDITQQKLLETQLRQAQKMEAVGLLSGGVAHDFNNLLTTIMGYSELILMNMPEDHPIRKDIEAIHNAGQKANALTRQLLAFSRKQVLEMKVVNLNNIVENMGKMLRRLIGEDLELKLHTTSPLGNILADSGQIEQIIMNLAVNARDAMPSGGSLIIETGNIYLDRKYAETHGGVKPGPHVMIIVTDNGIGMTKEVQRKIFDPFFTTKGLGMGTGLGLSTVYGIVKQHNGHIFVYSEPGNGTTFKIYFPEVDAAAEDVVSKKEKAMPRGTETVLVVDDESSVRSLIMDTLAPLGYSLMEASSSEEALVLSKATEKEIDLLLTDVVMPGMNGRELAEALMPARPNMKVIFVSGYTDNVIAYHGILKPGVFFINKPLIPSVLAMKVREVLDNSWNSSQ